MKTMCPPGYHHNGSVATHALGHMINNIATMCSSALAATEVVIYGAIWDDLDQNFQIFNQ